VTISLGARGETIVVNRPELQQLADQRVRDAAALLAADCWSGAYYLVGYAVECGLKACVLALVERTGVIYTDRKFNEKCWTHDVETLVKLADLEAIRGLAVAADADFSLNWQTAKDWSESARYEQKSEAEARRLFSAVTDAANGVLPWIRNHW
jgi:hypothetical protein